MIDILTRKQAVSIGRKIDSNNFGTLVGNYIQEARVLVGEAVVVLSPDNGCQEDVEGGNPDTPLHLETLFEPLAVLSILLVRFTLGTLMVPDLPG